MKRYLGNYFTKGCALVMTVAVAAGALTGCGKTEIQEKLFCLPHLFVDRQRLLVWDETSAGRCRRLLEAVVDDEGIKDVIVCILEPCLTDSLQLPAHEKIHQLRWSDTLNNAADLQLQINGRSVRWPQRHADFTIVQIGRASCRERV